MPYYDSFSLITIFQKEIRDCFASTCSLGAYLVLNDPNLFSRNYTAPRVGRPVGTSALHRLHYERKPAVQGVAQYLPQPGRHLTWRGQLKGWKIWAGWEKTTHPSWNWDGRKPNCLQRS